MIGRLLGVALILTACASPQTSSAPASSEPASESPSASATAAPTPSSTAAPTDEPPPNVIAWILDLAPGSPQGPPEFRAYRNLMNVGNDGCVALANGLQPDGGIELEDEALLLYRAVADACLAAFYDGYSGLWDSAAATFAGLPVPTSCMDVVAYRVLRDLLQAHQVNPNGTFQFTDDPAQMETPPCPVITQLDPDHGPPGTQVRISGFNLDHVHELRLFYEDDDEQVDDYGIGYQPDGEALLVTMVDLTDEPAVWACVVAQGAEDWNGSGMLFTFEEPGASPAATAAPGSPTAPCLPESTE